MKTIIIAAALVLAAGCQKSEKSTSTSTETTGGTLLVAGDQEFIAKAAQGGLLEVIGGRDVSARATSPDVKAFADHMVDDHSKANDELAALAAKKGVTVAKVLDDDHKKEVDKLAKLSGAKLDKTYASDMVDDHEKDVKEFQKAAKDVKDGDLRGWAAGKVGVLEHHLAMAKELEKKMKDR
jgi:putative membrane protein